MRNFKMVLAYDGAPYRGWQRLPGRGPTVQETVEEALSRALGARVEILGAGRTDAGVHAEGQCANFSADTRLEPEELRIRLNAALPEDIACRSLTIADPRFHARYWAIGKAYRYRLYDGPEPEPFARHHALHVREALDVALMRAAAEPLVGTHDFTSFTNQKEKGKSMVRLLARLAVERHGRYIDILAEGDGFLRNQVRIMAQALIEAGRGAIGPSGIEEMLAARKRAGAPPPAFARGLCLLRVDYGEGPNGQERNDD
jgi:tRNA pseudouridine38-40 synthase